MAQLVRCSAALLAALLAAAPAPAQNRGDRGAPRLAVPPGYCVLDPSRRADAAVISQWQEELARADELLRAAVPCDQLDAWRNPPMRLADYERFVIISGWRHERKSFDERARIPRTQCRNVRRQTGQPPDAPREDLVKRLSAALPAMKSGESKLIGVVEEDAVSCRMLVLLRARTNAAVLHLRATAFIRGEVLQFYQIAHVSNGREIAALESSAALLKQAIGAIK